MQDVREHTRVTIESRKYIYLNYIYIYIYWRLKVAVSPPPIHN